MIRSLFTWIALGVVALTAPLIAHAQTAATAQTQYVDVQGNRIGYRSIGSGSPIMLANRMRGTIDTWDPLFLDSLAKQNRVIVFDYPGIGYSSGTLPPDMGLAGAFIDDFAKAVGLDRYSLLGWSWGGLASQALLVARPERLTSAILVGTNPPGHNAIPIQQAFLDRAFKPVNDLADEEVLFFEPTSAASRQAAKVSRERIRVRPDVDAKIPSTIPAIQAFIDDAAEYREDPKGRRRALLKTSVPVLVICGDNDPSTAGANWFPLSGHIATAQLLVLPDSGHAPHHQYPELSAEYINAFIARAGR